jgi:signal transduction histidine kinase
VIPKTRVDQAGRFVRAIWNEPFTRRPWRELGFFVSSGVVAGLGAVFTFITMGAGIFASVTFFGIAIFALAIRGAREVGRMQRSLARSLLDLHIEEPPPFAPRPGFFGWLTSTLRDRAGWRAVLHTVCKIPLTVFGVWFALSVWIDAFYCLTYAVWGNGNTHPDEFGLIPGRWRPGYISVGNSGFFHGLFIFITGVLLILLAPWVMRVIVLADRWLMKALLSPDAVTLRVRSLEQARAQTVDESAAHLRRIERDLHDGTQAQLVALAMRLGQAKEKLEAGGADADVLEQVRGLIDQAHSGAKEAIVELRDLARGIHPPVLDTGLEGALATLAARSTLPTEVTMQLRDRPTPAIEAIAYFCVAELLANVAQHAKASRASVMCAQHGQWLRITVRDDGVGGARLCLDGSSSSGLVGLTDRVRIVDGLLYITSPVGGPTVITVDLPLHA